MKVTKFGFLNAVKEVMGQLPKDLMPLLTNSEPKGPMAAITVSFTLDKGMYSKPLPFRVKVSATALESQLSTPACLLENRQCGKGDNGFPVTIYAFKNHLFRVEIEQPDETDEQAVLIIKHQVYSQDAKWKKIKEEVALIEKVIDHGVQIKRTTIPEAVKLAVYARDEGKCIRCGSMRNLHFDHIIPVAKGGGNSEENIQILCQDCNLKKSDRISF